MSYLILVYPDVVGIGSESFVKTKEMLFQAEVFAVRRNFLVFWLTQNCFFVSAPLDVSLNVLPHTLSHRPVFSAVRSTTEDASHAAVHVDSCDTMGWQKAQSHAPPDDPETGDAYEYHRRERRSCAGQKIEHQSVHRRRNSSSASTYIRVYTSEADFHKPRMYGGSVQVWANAWDVFRRTPSRDGRGRRAAVDLFRGVFI